MSGFYVRSPFHGLQFDDLLMDTPEKFNFLSPSALQSGTLYDVRTSPYAIPSPAMQNFYSHPFFKKTEVQHNPLDLSQKKSTPPSNNIPSFTSPPAVSPYLGMSPALPSVPVNPLYGSAYLERLRSNPMFRDLQMLLAQECQHMQVPTNLINPSWNSRPVDNGLNVYTQHIKLQEKLLKMRSDPVNRQPVLEIESFYSAEVGKIEVARYQALCASSSSEQLHHSVNMQFDQKRLDLICDIESKLIQKKRKDSLCSISSSPESDSNSIEGRQLCNSSGISNPCSPDLDCTQGRQLVEDVPKVSHVDFDRQSRAFVAARQLSFMDSDKDTANADFSPELCRPLSASSVDSSSTCRSSPRLVIDVENISSDIPSASPPIDILAESVKATFSAREDSAILDVHNVDNCVSVSDNVHSVNLLNHENFMPTQKCNRDNFGFTSTSMFRSDESGYSYCDNSASVSSLKRKSPDTLCEEIVQHSAKRQKSEDGSSRLLTNEATDILNSWYNANIRYPYPQDEEVKQLSASTGLTVKQVKKWMANKRVRCYNTLSISGNQHPIKFKYKSQPKSCDNNVLKQQPQQLSAEVRQVLGDWFDAHVDHPYPSESEKSELAAKAGISVSQVRSWFANRRSRLNKTKKQVPNYFIQKFPEYSTHVQMVSYQREQARRGSKHHHGNSLAYFYPPYC
ncbi:hypothetical protein KUTeg_000092 [Tegillarca granosa]|uniref:Homeobox domain-containing protein n=1 Tax=Tegillarca granosa TaxID=220873 RepID=A0ABQ9FWK9_TEGGR|nr:hypothetical protein KUTeg_000092 [Tegillarca granosa]